MELHDVIRIRRRELGLSLEEIAIACNVGKSIVSKWERGEVSNLKRDSLAALADVLNVSPLVLLGREEINQLPPGAIPLPPSVQVPLVGQIACGTPILAEQNYEGMVSVPADWHADFALLCKGDSMAPDIRDGDIVAVRQQQMVDNGQIAAVLIDGEATLKRVELTGSMMLLKPQNSAFPTIVLAGDDLSSVCIEGRAIGICRKI